jgi:CRP/FNR family transcriptional regulator, dissimilatory nitrate respiration regulator
MDNFPQILSQTPLFNGLSQENLEKLNRIIVDKVHKKGSAIFNEGDDADGFYVVAEGRVKIYKVSLDGKEHILHIYGPGNPFGEVPMFSGQRFPANALALVKSRVLYFPRPAFVQLITENPSLSLNMLAVLSRRLREFTVQIENLSLKEVPSRLASYLIYLSQEQGDPDRMKLNVSKGQLASLLGTIPETLSRIFARMSAQNLIEVSGAEIEILDSEGLTDLAEYGKLLG